eukprot:TRINITY_DN9011_c0_g1_i1.p1 TRINITY_DN9011_c0_g1~~TRINITY_DN9011_c0_g1_i1.p1  ORF type:complete len:208 (+),score=46.74 TRINITY_DN9011_c0_g1_i1:194-817(+)
MNQRRTLFLFLDALVKERPFLHLLKPSLCIEIGTGSGLIITYLAQLLSPLPSLFMATDLNENAAKISSQTASTNHVKVEVIRTEFVSSLRVQGEVDVLLFNPPYVPTSDEEMEEAIVSAKTKGDAIAAAWAGGEDGTQVLLKLLPLLPQILSPKGVFYFVALKQNKIDVLAKHLKNLGFSSQVVLQRAAGIESLYIIKCARLENQGK